MNGREQNTLERNGLRHIRFHDLRHTTATLMIDGGFTIKVLQSWMRHANSNTLTNVYVHISPSTKNDMDLRIEKFFTSNINSSHIRKVLENQGKQGKIKNGSINFTTTKFISIEDAKAINLRSNVDDEDILLI